ncbi:MAG: shikimate kinase [Candidatus Sericytochromatia bacterium]|nr:shikimate kinase [Candidatus Sericytochromatia bacterium]
MNNILDRHIALIGLPSSGKSTLGKCLAEALNRPWLDSDHCFEAESGEKISDLFACGKEPRFRQWEQQWLAGLADLPPSVISTGGGLPCQPGALDQLKKFAYTIYLEVDLKLIKSRLRASQHPLLLSRSPAEFEALVQMRLPIYAQADYTLKAQGTPEELLKTLLGVRPLGH